MSHSRIYQSADINVGDNLQLSDDAAGHLIRVLRMQSGTPITLFNGNGNDYAATLSDVTKKAAKATITAATSVENESSLAIHLVQGISRGEKMDLTLQKSVELGVTEITPIMTERCGVKLSGERLEKKIQHWQKVVISACEQSGRAFVPKVNDAVHIDTWLSQNKDNPALKLNLHPKAAHGISQLDHDLSDVVLLIGPEGGLSDIEIEKAALQGFKDVLLGPRVLRTETAALCAISVLQSHFGDLG